jgi:hypothetical protein
MMRCGLHDDLFAVFLYSLFEIFVEFLKLVSMGQGYIIECVICCSTKHLISLAGICINLCDISSSSPNNVIIKLQAC